MSYLFTMVSRSFTLCLFVWCCSGVGSALHTLLVIGQAAECVEFGILG